MRLVKLIDRGLTALVTAVLIISFGLMLVLAVGQVLLRQVLHTSLAWGDLAARHLVIWVGFFGAYLASRREQHFHIGFLSQILGPRARPWVGAVTDVFAAAICVALVAASATFITVGLDPKAVLFLGIRQTTAALVVPAGFLLMAMQFVLHAILSTAGALTAPPAGADD